jgi:hypothetical protein
MALSLKIWQNKQCINNYKNISNSNLRDPSIHNWLKKFPLFSVRSKIQNSKSKIHISSLLGPILIRHFQWYKECLNSMSFEPYNRLLKVQESIGTPTPKVGAHLGVCGFIPLVSYILGSMKCDSRVSFLACTFASLRFGHKPKARVATIKFLNPIFNIC